MSQGNLGLRSVLLSSQVVNLLLVLFNFPVEQEAHVLVVRVRLVRRRDGLLRVVAYPNGGDTHSAFLR